MGGPPPGGTPLDIAAIIDRVLQRNINWPFRTVEFGIDAITVLDRYLALDATGGDITLGLPDAADAGAGMSFKLIRIDSTANEVVIGGVGGQTINGAASVSILQQYSALEIVSDGANWLLYASPTAFAAGTDVLWIFPGTLSTDQNANFYTLEAARAMAFVAFDVQLNVDPTGADLILQWLVNGILEPSATVTVPDGDTYAETIFTLSLSPGDTLQPVVSQVGGATPGMTMVARARGQ